MAQAVQGELVTHGIENGEIWVDREFVYLEMHYGSEHLYQVFSRDLTMSQSSELTRGDNRGEG